jgi:uncharacterized protein
LKLQLERTSGVNTVTGFAPGSVRINSHQVYTHSLLLPWRGEVLTWPCSDFADLTPQHFEQVLALKPELVIFGSGWRLRFAASSLLCALTERRIGLETMDTAAACRTYNVLANEGRQVVAALLLDEATRPTA